VAQLRGMALGELAAATTRNALEALPRLESLLSLSEGRPHRA
jgi:TatD DNase family protein